MAFFVVMYIKFLCPRSKKVQETIKGVHFLTALSKIPQCYVLAFALKFCETHRNNFNQKHCQERNRLHSMV